MPSEHVYHVVFQGHPLPGVTLENAILGLAELLRKPPEEVAHYFNNHPRVVKRGIPKDKAEQYCRTLENAGLSCRIIEAKPQSNTDEEKKTTAPEKKSSSPASAEPADQPELIEEDTINANDKIETEETIYSDSQRWADYWKGSIILSLLIAGLALFIPDAKSPILAGLLSIFIFIICYPSTRFYIRMLGYKTSRIIIVGIGFGGGPLAVLMCYVVVRFFSQLFKADRYFVRYLIASIIFVLMGSILGPFSEFSKRDMFGTFIDSRDGKVYKTVQIGDQLWMAENLSYNSGSGCYVVGDVEKYGFLYDFDIAGEVCPAGWHLPTNEEWKILINYLGGEDVAGEKLKSKKGWDKYHGKNYGNNQSGFSALPAGFKDPPKSAKWDIGGKAYFWSNTAYLYVLYCTDTKVRTEYPSPLSDHGYSVRCIRD